VPENFLFFYPILSQALILSVLIGTLFRLRQFGAIILIVCLGGLLFPIKGLPMWFYIRSVVGDLSISLTVICAGQLFVWFLSKFTQPHSELQVKEDIYSLKWTQFSWIFFAAGIVLYPFALGISHIDPYAWGYNPLLMSSILIVLVSVTYLQEKNFLTFLFSSVLLAYSLNIMESNNLWDYLLDPLLFLICMLILSKEAWQFFVAKNTIQ